MRDLFCTSDKAGPQRSMLRTSLNVLFPQNPQSSTLYSLYMHAMIALFPIPFALRGLEMICIFGLKASTLDKLVTVRLVHLVSVAFLEKDGLDVMIPLIIRTLNPDPFRLVYGWYSHGSSHFVANTHYDENRNAFPGERWWRECWRLFPLQFVGSVPSFLLLFQLSPRILRCKPSQSIPQDVTSLRILRRRKRRA